MLRNKDVHKLKGLKVTIIGDIIIDAYQFIQPVGKSSKSATITANILDENLQIGGAGVIANHVTAFSENVNLISYLGSNVNFDSKEFILKNLDKNVNFMGINIDYKPTVTKRRFVDNTFRSHKLLEINEINDNPIKKNDINKLVELIENAERESDVIIVADFGHGLLNDKTLISKINNLKCFVSLMVQTNSLNYGFNLITKYKKADFFVIDQREADLALKSRDKNYKNKIKFLSKKLKTSKSVITMGKKGCLIIDTKTGELIERSPKVKSQIVLDTVGSGDAFFSITSLLSYCNFEISKIADLGNVAGHFAVSYLGNEYNIGKLFQSK